MTINDKQSRMINIVIGSLAALGGITAFIGYMNSRKHTKIKEEIALLDKAIKELDLKEKKNGIKN
jgi:heme O synthase-like polyprenyltransferase